MNGLKMNSALRKAVKNAEWNKIPGPALRHDVKSRVVNWLDQIDALEKMIISHKKAISENRKSIKNTCRDWEI